jgi:hypothetical protein
LSVALVGAIQNNASYAFGRVLNEDEILFHTLRFLVVRYDGFSYNLVTRTPQTLIHPLDRNHHARCSSGKNRRKVHY